MKLDEHIIEKDKVEIVGQAEKKYEVKKATINPYRGHSLFQFDLKNKTITVAEFEEQNIEFLKLDKAWSGVTKKVIIKPDCIYISALNQRNAEKKFMKQAQAYDKLIAGK